MYEMVVLEEGIKKAKKRFGVSDQLSWLRLLYLLVM